MSLNISKQIEDFIEIARLAPSSHNTQPWTAAIVASKIIIGYDPKRRLPVGDPDNTELLISLGSFIETLICTASENGYNATYTYIGDAPGAIAELLFKKQANTDAIAWTQLIAQRRSDRRLFEDRQLDSKAATEIMSLTRGHAQVVLIEDKHNLSVLADTTQQATLTAMSKKEFRTELASWVRNNKTRKPDGMPGHAQGMPTLVSFAGPWLVKNLKPVPADQAKKDARRVQKSSAVALICLGSTRPEDLIDSGRLYQAVCLTALQYNIKSAGISAAVVDPITNDRIKKTLNLALQPTSLIRLGYHKGTVKKSPRRVVSDILL